MAKTRIKLPCLYDNNFEKKADESITQFLDETCSKQDNAETLVRKTHDLTRRYFDSSLIRKIVNNWCFS